MSSIQGDRQKPKFEGDHPKEPILITRAHLVPLTHVEELSEEIETAYKNLRFGSYTYDNPEEAARQRRDAAFAWKFHLQSKHEEKTGYRTFCCYSSNLASNEEIKEWACRGYFDLKAIIRASLNVHVSEALVVGLDEVVKNARDQLSIHYKFGNPELPWMEQRHDTVTLYFSGQVPLDVTRKLATLAAVCGRLKNSEEDGLTGEQVTPCFRYEVAIDHAHVPGLIEKLAAFDAVAAKAVLSCSLDPRDKTLKMSSGGLTAVRAVLLRRGIEINYSVESGFTAKKKEAGRPIS